VAREGVAEPGAAPIGGELLAQHVPDVAHA
jgi:hypothetical protein